MSRDSGSHSSARYTKKWAPKPGTGVIARAYRPPVEPSPVRTLDPATATSATKKQSNPPPALPRPPAPPPPPCAPRATRAIERLRELASKLTDERVMLQIDNATAFADDLRALLHQIDRGA